MMATNETPEQREARLARRREQYRQRHAAETADAREARLERQRESARRRRAMESVSDRNARLSQARRHQWKRVSTETSGERLLFSGFGINWSVRTRHVTASARSTRERLARGLA